jgi:hypothetical protein
LFEGSLRGEVERPYRVRESKPEDNHWVIRKSEE